MIRSGVPAGNIFPIGVTMITWTATDVFGNVTTKTQKITVTDTQKPVLTVPPAVTVTVSSTQTSTFISDAQLGSASATDSAGAVTIVRTGVPTGNIFPLGKTTITYTATDPNGNTAVGTQIVTVTGPPIVVTAGPSQSSSEGATTTFNLGSSAGGAGTWTTTIDWGDGTPTSSFSSVPGALSASHKYTNDRSTPYTVKVTVTDVTGSTSSASFGITVTNLAPAVTITSPSAGPYNTGVALTARASFTDAGTSDTHTCTVTWGDGTTSTGTVSESGGAGTCTATRSYTAGGSYTITVNVADNAGATTSASVAISVVKPTPVVMTPGPSQSTSEGSAKTFNLGSFSGGAGPYTVTVNWGDGSPLTTFTASPGALAATHTYVNDRSTAYTVTVTVTDATGASASSTFAASVTNVAPTVTITSPLGGAVFKTGTTTSLSASFNDPGTADTHTCTIAWGDGSTSTGTVAQSGASGTCTASKTYKSVGNYTITATVKDSAGATATATVTISVTKTGAATSGQAGTMPVTSPTSDPNAQLVASTPPAIDSAATLTSAELQAITAAAERAWLTTGIAPAQFTTVRFVITRDLPYGEIGYTDANTIYLDATADGFGWYTGSSVAFDAQGVALAGGPAEDRIDLLTVVLHELGHTLGLPDGCTCGLFTELMQATLPAGVQRLLPTAATTTPIRGRIGSSLVTSPRVRQSPRQRAATIGIHTFPHARPRVIATLHHMSK